MANLISNSFLGIRLLRHESGRLGGHGGKSEPNTSCHVALARQNVFKALLNTNSRILRTVTHYVLNFHEKEGRDALNSRKLEVS